MRQSPRAGSKRQGAGYWIRKARIEGCGAKDSRAGRSLERGATAKGRGRGRCQTNMIMRHKPAKTSVVLAGCFGTFNLLIRNKTEKRT